MHTYVIIPVYMYAMQPYALKEKTLLNAKVKQIIIFVILNFA